MSLLVKNIGLLVGIDESGRLRVAGEAMKSIATLPDAWLLTEGTRIKDYGPMEQLPTETPSSTLDAEGGWLLPSYCDSHTHIVYAGSREREFLDKINGLSYEQIAANGGGILNSADRLHDTPEDELYRQAMERIDEIVSMGTGLVEIKSGYGLTLDDELKILRVIRRIKENAPLEVRATFLGAHAVGRAFKGRQRDYVNHVCDEMIPAVAAEHLADFIDVFCDRGFFTPEETAQIIERGAAYGLSAKIHANELAVSGGVEVGVRHKALSVDHLESMGDEQIQALKGSDTIPTMLPGCAFFLGISYPPARKMIDAGLAVALASDYNPGTAPSGNMRFVASLASIKMKMTPAEALNASTLNSACAMGLSNDYGSITRGKVANFYITKPLPSLAFIPYAHQTPIIKKIVLKGKLQ
ncbi:MAG: imidazolonepropionase [Bacteroidaceae bacterium]|nr:imidazolonepropionase [Bacteroidaceae bacterium]MBR3855989.1 imidazolonepropionase [Bacteroidaceae bacterium]